MNEVNGQVEFLPVPESSKTQLPPAQAQAAPPGLESLMAGYLEANEKAARTLVETVTPALLRYFLVQNSNRRFAEDLMQETWMRVHRARHTYRKGEPVLPWIFAIARHTGVDYYRRARRTEAHEAQVETLPEQASPEANGEASLPEIDRLLAELPPSQREVLIMLKVSGMSLEEVARATSSSIGSVKQKAHRAYEKLRSVLAGRVQAGRDVARGERRA